MVDFQPICLNHEHYLKTQLGDGWTLNSELIHAWNIENQQNDQRIDQCKINNPMERWLISNSFNRVIIATCETLKKGLP